MKVSLTEFFDVDPEERFDKWFDPNRRPASLRLIEFFFNIYLLLHEVTWNIDGGSPQFPRKTYEKHLSILGKPCFDPFKRQSISPPMEYRGVQTTIGQMFFLRYLIMTGADLYIRMHREHIFQTMRVITQNHRRRAGTNGKKKSGMLSEDQVVTMTRGAVVKWDAIGSIRPVSSADSVYRIRGGRVTKKKK